MGKTHSIILAANRLPATLVQTKRGKQWRASPGGMAAALMPVQKKSRATWIGWNGLHQASEEIPPFSRGLQGLHIDADLYNRYYNVVANGTLWPAFHGLQPEPFTKADWKAYKKVNEQFADAIAATAKPNDLIWIHDFHLLLVPQFLRQHGLKNKIGLFLHIPFVGHKHMSFPHAQELLAGLMQADLCGVQTARDARQLTTCLKQFFPKTRLPHVRAFPIGIDAQRYQSAFEQHDVQRQFANITAATAEKYVLFSLSRLDYTKGILNQLRAVELAVQNGLKNARYKLIVSPSREGVGAYRKLKIAIDHEVTRIQKALPDVIDYQYQNADFAEVCAWFARADVCLVAPLVDGMNLVAKEYLAVKPATQDGVLILSTQAGAAQQLKEALQVDPNDIKAMAAALLRAQAMPKSERHKRAQAIRQNVSRQDVFWWAEQCITALQKT